MPKILAIAYRQGLAWLASHRTPNVEKYAVLELLHLHLLNHDIHLILAPPDDVLNVITVSDGLFP